MTINEQKYALPAWPRPLVAVMSSGFFGFFAHAGFLQALEDLGLEPDAYAGTSSGALVAALAAAGTKPAAMLEGFRNLRKRDFWDPPALLPWLGHLLRGWRGQTGYLRGEAFERLMAERLPVATFAECAKPCLMVALDLGTGQRVILSEGPLAPAVRASGAVPILFAAVKIQGRLLVDGGLVDKAPLAAAVESLGARTLLVHMLGSASLERPLEQALASPLAPLRLQRRAVDAARWQHYQDQREGLRGRDIEIMEVMARGLPRLGPGRLEQGPEVFSLARGLAKREMASWASIS
jgi:NTE family protein